jgi:hypothetical protein
MRVSLAQAVQQLEGDPALQQQQHSSSSSNGQALAQTTGGTGCFSARAQQKTSEEAKVLPLEQMTGLIRCRDAS